MLLPSFVRVLKSRSVSLSIVAVLLSLAALQPVTTAADPRITPEERATLIKYLRQSETEFIALLDDVSEAQWRWKAAPERWSVA